MILSRRLAPILLATLCALLAVAPVHAQTLTGDERIVDEAGVIDDEQRAEALEAIAALDDSQNVQLWALFVDSTGGEPPDDYTNRVADENGLGVNDALLVVAVDDQRYQLWIADALEADVSVEEHDAILVDRIEPELRDGDWGGAIAAAANGLAAAIAGDEAPQPEPGGQPAPEPDEEGGSSIFPLLIALALVGGGAWLIWNWFRQRRAVAEEDRERTRRLTQLSQRANALLIETDELLRHNAQELGFVEAEFGADAADPFRQALAAARGELQAAFRLRQSLDDNTPETPPERQAMLDQVIAHCTKAQELVAEQTEHFRELRDLERRAPEILSTIPARVADLNERIAGVETAIDELRREASGSSQAVQGNVTEARKRLELATRATSEGQAALDRGEAATAARAAKAAQEAVGQASALLDAVDHEAAVLGEARVGLSTAMAQARADLQAAATAVRGASGTDQADELAAAEAKLDAAEAAMSGSPRDTVLAYRLAREAEAAADGVVAAVREGEERRAKERAAVEAAVRAAELQVDRAEEFISARRHGVGRRPRTALSEADAALARARELRDSNPVAALEEARRAGELADEAYRRAQADFTATDDAGFGGTVVINGRPYRMGRGSWGGDVGGAVLGGIIGSILSGGGRRGGWGGGGFGGGGFGGGGFGGGGRSFGGGFGGGGGRSRGGGW